MDDDGEGPAEPRRFARRARLGGAVLALLLASAGPARAEVLTEGGAVSRAVSASPDLRAAVADLRVASETLTAAEATYRPVFTADVGGGHSESLAATLDGVAPSSVDSVEASAGVGYTAPFGTSVDVTLSAGWYRRDVNRDPSATTTLTLGATYGAGAQLDVAQPLLRGSGTDVGEASIRAARHGRTAAEEARALAASALVRDVVSAYWELWYAEAAVEVQRAARDLAARQLAEAEARADQLGTVARTEALRFATELASLEESLAEAESTRRQRAIELGRLLAVEPTEAVALRVDAAAPPPAERVGAETVAAEAAGRSPELRQLQAQLEATRDQVRVARDATLPRLDLRGSLGVAGLWNDTTISDLSLPDDRPALSGWVGLELELPIGNARAEAELAEAEARAAAAEARLESRRRAISAEAARLVDDLDTARRRLELAEETARVARQLADAEGERLRLGTATTTEVLDAQEGARATELRRLRALVDQASAAAQVAHAVDRLLPRYAASLEAP